MEHRATARQEGRELQDWPELIDIDELAGILGVRKGTIYNWVHRRKIPFVKVGRLVRFERSEITKYLQTCRMEPLAGKG